ncbi:AEC family transporter [Bauldia sp.]|uniref:AEC family transporter n=1 Tax=Bauldia sp. TaxID=2575872 RepID=UPI003BAB65FB
MTHLVDIVLPVFGLIAIGYVVGWSGLLGRATGEAIVDFVFVIAIPVFIFRTLATAEFAEAPWRIWLPFFSVFAVMWVLGDQAIRRFFARDARAGLVAGVSAAYGNTVLVGIPLATAAYGSEGAVAIALIIAIHMPVAMTASTILIGRAERRDGVAGASTSPTELGGAMVRNLIKNPIIIGLALGVVWGLIGLPYSGLGATLIDEIADVAPPLALFSLGMALRRYGIRRNVPAGLVLSMLKLFVMPGLVLLLAVYVVPMPPVWAKVAVIAAACPTGINAYLIAARFRTGEALASNAITLSTGLAVITATVWLGIVAAI